MTAPALQERALALVEEGFHTLPERYLGAPKGFDVTYHVRLGDVGHTFEVRCTEHRARVRKGISARPADVVIGTDAEIAARLRADDANANANLPRLARLAEVWEKINRAARDTAEYNLERKPLVFSVFGLLAEALN